MSDYAITFARSARKELESLDGAVVRRVFARIEALSQDPRPSHCKKLKGSRDLWRIRIGDYRVVYRLDDKAHLVDVISVQNRRDVYR